MEIIAHFSGTKNSTMTPLWVAMCMGMLRAITAFWLLRCIGNFNIVECSFYAVVVVPCSLARESYVNMMHLFIVDVGWCENVCM